MTDLHRSHENSLQHRDIVASVFIHPDDVLDDTGLTADEKRELLASWASDARALPHLPTLRQLPNGSIVKLHDILDALKALDAGTEAMHMPGKCVPLWRQPLERRRRAALRRRFRYGRSPDDDDDPPPCPAFLAPRPKGGGGAAHARPEPVAA